MRSFLFFILAIFCTIQLAVKANATSLSNSIIQNVETYDTTYINKILDTCWFLRSSRANIGLEYCQNAIQIIEQSNHIALKPKALNYFGVIYRKLGETNKSLPIFNEALKFAELTKNKKETAYALNNLSDYYIDKTLYVLALENALKAYEIFNEIGFSEGLSYSLNNLGKIYMHQNLYDKAIDTLLSAIDIRKTLNDDIRLSISLQRLASVYMAKNQYGKAFEIYTSLLEANENNNNLFRKAAILDLISNIHIKQKKYELALKPSLESLEIYQAKSENKKELETLNRIGSIYTALEKNKLAFENLLLAEQLATEMDDKTQKLLNYFYQAQLADQTKNFQLASNYYAQYISLKDSIFNYLNQSKILELEVAYQNLKKEKKLLLFKEKAKSNQIMLIFLSISLFVLLLTLIHLFKLYKNKQQINEELVELNHSKDLFFSILAHDLKEPFINFLGLSKILNNSYSSLPMKEVKNIIDGLYGSAKNMNELLTKLLEWSRATTGRINYNPTSFAIHLEAENVLNLLAGVAESKQLQLKSEINESHVVKADPNMINTIMRNLISNAIKFTPKRGNIKLSSEKKGNKIKISVSDNGIGIPQNEINRVLRTDIKHSTPGTNNEKGTGIGLALCKELIKTNGGKLRVESKPGKGSKFYFSLPMA